MRYTFLTGFAGAAGLMLAACSVFGQSVIRNAVPLQKTQWMLTWVDGTRVQGTSPRQPFIELDPATHRMSGFGGCNRLMGTYEMEGDHLRLTRTGRTLMACAAGMDSEGKLVEALEQVREWKISDGELELRDAAGHDVARFTAAAQQ